MRRRGKAAELVTGPTPHPAALGTTAIRAALVSSVGNSSGFVLRFALNAILARYLGPTTFGVFALAFSYSELLGAIGAFSFPQALVQLDPDRRRLLGTALWMTVLVTAALLVPALVAMPFIRARDGSAVAGAFLALVALRTLNGVTACVEGEMQQTYSYGRLALMRVAGVVVSAAAAYAAVVGGWRLGALFLREAVPFAVVLVIGGAFAVRANGLELFRIDRATAREIWALGRSLVKVRGLEIGFARLDHLVVGVVLGTHDLGLYSQARYISTLPNAALAPATNAVGLRVMSGVKDDPARLGKAYSVLQYGLARLTIGTGVACLVAPDLVIALALGPEWLEAADILRGLSLWIVLLPLFELDKALLVARRSWGGVYAAYVVKVVLLAAGVWAAARLSGPVGAALAASAALLAGFLVARAAARREVRARSGTCWPAMIASGVAIAAGAAARHASNGLAPLAEALSGLAVAGTAYVATLMLLERDRLLEESRYVIGRLFGRGAGSRRSPDARNAAEVSNDSDF